MYLECILSLVKRVQPRCRLHRSHVNPPILCYKAEFLLIACLFAIFLSTSMSPSWDSINFIKYPPWYVATELNTITYLLSKESSFVYFLSSFGRAKSSFSLSSKIKSVHSPNNPTVQWIVLLSATSIITGCSELNERQDMNHPMFTSKHWYDKPSDSWAGFQQMICVQAEVPSLCESANQRKQTHMVQCAYTTNTIMLSDNNLLSSQTKAKS